ncbi:hypothetical protein [Streptomyces sp. PvR034]
MSARRVLVAYGKQARCDRRDRGADPERVQAWAHHIGAELAAAGSPAR